jgi:hypothetical protein
MLNSIKFHNADKITIIYSHVNIQENSIPCVDYDPDETYGNIIPKIIIGPVIDRVKCVKSSYELEIKLLPEKNSAKENVSMYHICLNNFNNHMEIKDESMLASKTNIYFTTDYKHFKKHFKIISASKIDPDIPMTETDMLDDLTFMNDEIVTCQINMNMFKQKGDMVRYAFYNNMLNTQQHKMFHIPTSEQYDEYLNKISLLVSTNVEFDKIQNKKIMDEVSWISETIWHQ